MKRTLCGQVKCLDYKNTSVITMLMSKGLVMMAASQLDIITLFTEHISMTLSMFTSTCFYSHFAICHLNKRLEIHENPPKI